MLKYTISICSNFCTAALAYIFWYLLKKVYYNSDGEVFWLFICAKICIFFLIALILLKCNLRAGIWMVILHQILPNLFSIFSAIYRFTDIV